MDLGLKGKIAIVAASSSGLGRATAATLAREGALVTVNGRDPESLARTAAEIRKETGGDVIEIAGDLRVPDACSYLVEETVRQRGGLDVLVCNAGGPPPGDFATFADQGDQAWLDAVNLNLMSTIRLSRAALPHLEARGGGSITNLVSISVKQPIPDLVLSNTARTAVIGFAKSLAGEFASKQIRVNNICPGSILTNRVFSLAKPKAEASGRPIEDVIAEDAAAIPMGRHGTPEEFANAVVFIASPAASYITGVTLQVDGGIFRGLM
jgi:3-oxoacyl-[acyl-carrier protein] reductase